MAYTTEYFTSEQFSQVFKGKVNKICSATARAPKPTFASRCESQLVMTSDEVRRLLSHAPSKQCSLDPVPTWLLKALTYTVPDVIARLINASLQSGIFLSSQQHTLVKPVLKRQQMDPSNYRPISNLSFLSKLLERTVACRLTEYFEYNNLMPVKIYLPSPPFN